LKKPAKLVVDANPLVSALLGGASRRVFFDGGIQEFAVPESVIREVTAYLPELARKLGHDTAFLAYALDLLPLTRYAAGAHRKSLPQARARIEARDPKDVEVLALALSLGYPLWSNDRDFEGTGIQQFTTARLLNMLFEQESEG
jgi:predicted nucleic acid-binding protein